MRLPNLLDTLPILGHFGGYNKHNKMKYPFKSRRKFALPAHDIRRRSTKDTATAWDTDTLHTHIHSYTYRGSRHPQQLQAAININPWLRDNCKEGAAKADQISKVVKGEEWWWWQWGGDRQEEEKEMAARRIINNINSKWRAIEFHICQVIYNSFASIESASRTRSFSLLLLPLMVGCGCCCCWLTDWLADWLTSSIIEHLCAPSIKLSRLRMQLCNMQQQAACGMRRHKLRITRVLNCI